MSPQISASRYILRGFVLLGVVGGLIAAIAAAASGYWLGLVVGLAWAGIGLILLAGPNLARANKPLSTARLRWRLWRHRPRRA